MPQDRLHAIAPVLDDALEHPDQVVGHAATILARDLTHGIPQGHIVSVSRIEVDRSGYGLPGDQSQQAGYQVTMRIQNDHPVPLLNVMEDHRFGQRGFAHTAGTDHVYVAPPHLGCEADEPFTAGDRRHTDRNSLGQVEVHRCERIDQIECRIPPFQQSGRRHVDQAGQFVRVREETGSVGKAGREHSADLIRRKDVFIVQFRQAREWLAAMLKETHRRRQGPELIHWIGAAGQGDPHGNGEEGLIVVSLALQLGRCRVQGPGRPLHGIPLHETGIVALFAKILLIGQELNVLMPGMRRRHRLEEHLVQPDCRRRKLDQGSDQPLVRRVPELLRASQEPIVRGRRQVVPQSNLVRCARQRDIQDGLLLRGEDAVLDLGLKGGLEGRQVDSMAAQTE